MPYLLHQLQVGHGLLGVGVIGKALKNKLWKLQTIDIKKFGKGNYKKIDDTTAGGGPGMILKADVLGPAIDKSLKGCEDKKMPWHLLIFTSL